MKTATDYGRERFSFEERRLALQKFRKMSGLSQTELARLAKVSQPKVSRFENGGQDLGTASFGRVVKALSAAVADRRLALANAVTLASLRGAQSPTQAHYFNIDRRTAGGGFVLEYQGPGMIVCEEYRFENGAELMEFIDKCLAFGEMVWSSKLEPPEDDD